ncbi:MAG: hypothetical protein QM640_07290 [Niabella sp.]
MNKKMNADIKNFLLPVALAGLLALGLASCKKEYTDRYNEIAGDTLYVSGNTGIVSFVVNEFDEDSPIEASITGDSIIVLWSAYTTPPDSISPVITLPDSATVYPASGEQVAFATGTEYTVTSAAGIEKKYYLKIDYRQVQPTNYILNAKSTFIQGGFYYIKGSAGSNGMDNLLPDTSVTRVYLVSATDSTTEYDCEVATMTTYGVTFWVPATVPEGTYDLRIQNGAYTLTNQNTNYLYSATVTTGTVSSTASSLTLGAPFNTIARGDTFMVAGVLLNNVTNSAVIRNSSDNQYYSLEIVSISDDYRWLTLRIPDDAPLGLYRQIWLSGTSNVSTSSKFTIIE